MWIRVEVVLRFQSRLNIKEFAIMHVSARVRSSVPTASWPAVELLSFFFSFFWVVLSASVHAAHRPDTVFDFLLGNARPTLRVRQATHCTARQTDVPPLAQ